MKVPKFISGFQARSSKERYFSKDETVTKLSLVNWQADKLKDEDLKLKLVVERLVRAQAGWRRLDTIRWTVSSQNKALSSNQLDTLKQFNV